MRPRLIVRTHYQVDEPAFMRLLVLKCSSPVRSAYGERAAECLAKELQAAGREFNAAAGGYAVDLAQSLGLLNDNIVWTSRAQVLSAISADELTTLELSLPERLLFFRLFLEEDGAALLFLARLLTKHGGLPEKGIGWADVANAMVISVFEEYLRQAAEPAERITLRRVIERRRATPYTGKSGPHQLFVHLQALYRIGLVRIEDSGAARKYTLLKEAATAEPLTLLLATVPDLIALEKCVADHLWVDVAAAALGHLLPACRDTNAAIDDTQLFSKIRSIYETVLGTGVTLCPIQSIVEVLQISSLASGEGRLTQPVIISAIERLRKLHPRDVRFHVDRNGRPAYIKLSSGVTF